MIVKTCPAPVSDTAAIYFDDKPSDAARMAAQRAAGLKAPPDRIAWQIPRSELTQPSPFRDLVHSPMVDVVLGLARLATVGDKSVAGKVVAAATLLVGSARFANDWVGEMQKPPGQRRYLGLGLKGIGLATGGLGLVGAEPMVGDLSVGALLEFSGDIALSESPSRLTEHAFHLGVLSAADTPQGAVAGFVQSINGLTGAAVDPSPEFSFMRVERISEAGSA